MNDAPFKVQSVENVRCIFHPGYRPRSGCKPRLDCKMCCYMFVIVIQNKMFQEAADAQLVR